MLISDVVEYAARKHPRRAAVLFEDEEITFAELRDRVRRTANALRAVVLEGEAGADDIIAFAREHLGGYKVPQRVEIVSELPRNVAGKVLKRELRTLYKEVS